MVPVIGASTHDGTHFLKDLVWPLVCLGCSLLGMAIRVHCVGHAPKGTSGRNTKEQIADHLNTTGFYSIVRHPLYLGNFLIAFGIIALPQNAWLIGLFILSFALYYERIMYTEEAFLRDKFGSSFEDWANNTPAFIPSFARWKKPSNHMQYKKAACQEAAAVGVITIGFTSVELAEHCATGRMASIEKGWLAFAFMGTAIYLTLRVYKRYSFRYANQKTEDNDGALNFVGTASSQPFPRRKSALIVSRGLTTMALLIVFIINPSSSFAQQRTAESEQIEGTVNLKVSRVYTFVDKTGLGHQHAIEGTLAEGRLSLDQEKDAGRLVFDMTSFDADTQTARNYLGLEGVTSESTRVQVNENMRGRSILNVARHPTATFDIESSLASNDDTAEGHLSYRLIGTFTLCGRSQPLSLDVKVAKARGWLSIRGNFPIKQTSFGITPYSKAFGAIGVADTLQIYGELWVAPTSKTEMATIPERK